MGKEARNEDLELSREEQEHFDRLVALLAKRRFGEDGPPRNTTFAEIEQFGHQAGRMVARAIDSQLVSQHAAHFTDEQPCPTCNEKCPSEESPHKLPLATVDGDISLHEPNCHCSSCRRDFFPGTHRIAD